ncbi:MAG: hypothetical protein GYA51_01360 [Candidatus Methanofastidiosa archaeon]|nr:hypothetical protein [Candidatus Methanofastidiosa archaeon]
MKKLNLSKFKITNKGLYWGLIVTFAFLYLFVGFVSTLHSITFFNLANTMSLAILLGITYEIGQASVLFSILMTKNKDKFLPWALMFLLTALQVTANVYASFKYMATSGSNDWMYWQKSILIGVQAENAEMYQVIISWIAGALLPIVALGMTALVAQNIKLMTEETTEVETTQASGEIDPARMEAIIENEVEKRIRERDELDEQAAELIPTAEDLKQQYDKYDRANDIPVKLETQTAVINEPIEIQLQKPQQIDPEVLPTPPPIKPVNKIQGWHFLKEFVDDDHNVFQKGKFIGNDPSKIPTSKKA